MRETIRIEGLRVLNVVGADAAERHTKQQLVVDLRLTLPDASARESLDDTIDYVKVADLVREVAVSKAWVLIEAFARECASKLIELGFTAARVCVHKPFAASKLQADSVSVEISI